MRVDISGLEISCTAYKHDKCVESDQCVWTGRRCVHLLDWYSKRQIEKKTCDEVLTEPDCRTKIECWWISQKSRCISLVDQGDGETMVEEEPTRNDGEAKMSGDVCPLMSNKDECQSDSTCLWTVKCISIASLSTPQTDGADSKAPAATPSGVPAVPASTISVNSDGPDETAGAREDHDVGGMSNDFQTQSRQRFEVQASMELKPWDGEWNSGHQKLWRRITQQRVRSHALELIERDDLETYSSLANDGGELSVTITVGSTELGPSSQRRLGSADPTLTIDFSTVIEFPSSSSDWDAAEMLSIGFSSVRDQNEYLETLKSESRFAGVATMNLRVGGTQVAEAPVSLMKSSLSSNDGSRSDKSLTYLIVGIVGGILVAVAIVISAAFYLKKRSSRTGHIDLNSVGSVDSFKHEESDCDRTQSSSPSPEFERNERRPYFGTVRTSHQSDVSTIGDPYIGEPVSRDPVSDDTVALSEHEVLYGGAHPLTSRVLSTSTGMTSGAFSSGRRIVFRDDEGLEDVWLDPTTGITSGGSTTKCRRVTVEAPPGKIGIVLDGSDCAVVSAVANTSPLRADVAIGDILVEIDGLDVTGMRAQLVSQLISSKSKRPRRTLVLMRSDTLHSEL